MTDMWRILGLLVLSLAGIAVLILFFGARRWESATRALQSQVDAARLDDGPATYDERQLAGLPPPVQRYFRAALADGQPVVRALRLDHIGTFDASDTVEQWKPFTSQQRVVIRRPGFVWDARIVMAAGMPVRVHDAYVNGEGILHAAVLSLFTVANVRGTPEVAQGELMRFLAEAAWYPTALLPGHGVRWDPVDDDSASATLTDGNTSVTLTFHFNAARLIESVRADARGRTVGNTIVPTPWEGRWTRYELRDGLRVPTEGEVAWILPEGRKPYWRGRVTALAYEFALR